MISDDTIYQSCVFCEGVVFADMDHKRLRDGSYSHVGCYDDAEPTIKCAACDGRGHDAHYVTCAGCDGLGEVPA